ncbi:hypothetical protein ACWD4G_19570 [Streptomyces sp. NPDC002643]
MRSISLPKLLLAATLGCLVLSGCGGQKASAGRTGVTADQAAHADSTVSATSSPDPLADSDDPEIRFLALTSRITQNCVPDAPVGGGNASGEVPEPEDLPGYEPAPTELYGPDETPPALPGDATEPETEVADPLEDHTALPTPPSDSPETETDADADADADSGTEPVAEVPLGDVEQCGGTEHARRITEAFRDTETTGYEAMREKLTGLDYPATRIHRMPDHAGAPRARLDLRFMGGHLALEVTATSRGVIVEAFGAPETEDVRVTDVRRKPNLDAPTS